MSNWKFTVVLNWSETVLLPAGLIAGADEDDEHAQHAVGVPERKWENQEG